MAKLVWDQDGERLYENGVDCGVLFVKNGENGAYSNGVAWNGLISVQTTPSGGEANDYYADNIKYLSIYSIEETGASIEAYTYPDEFAECDGSKFIGNTKLLARAQTRVPFGISWRTKIGSDQDNDHGYMIHILYGCKASPSERQYQTINENSEPMTFSWDITTIAPEFPARVGQVELPGYKRTALFEVKSTDFTTTNEKAALTALETKLWGGESESSTLPTISELITLLTPAS